MPYPAWRLSTAWAVRLPVAGGLFWVAYDGGTFGLVSRTTLAILAWWAVLLAVMLGLAPRERIPRPALASGALLAAFAAWSALSIGWAVNDEKALVEVARALLYLAVFALVLVASTRATARAWLEGLALAVAATGLLALLSRLFPGVLPDSGLPRFFGANAARLSYPLNYWNGLGAFVGLGAPLLLSIAASARPLLLRGLAVGVIPPLAVVVYLTSSRGGAVVAAVGVLVLLGFSAHRWRTLGAAAAAFAGATAAVAIVRTQEALVDAPSTEAAEEQGIASALVLALIALVSGSAYAACARFLSRRLRPSRRAGQLAVAAAALLAVTGAILADPARRFDDFTRDPRLAELQGRGPIERHLVSSSGSGRWQQWGTALDQFRAEPLAGGGAGSHEAWSIEYSTLPEYTTEAHSLYLESLAELGLVGGILIAAAFVLALVEGARRAVREREDTVAAALLASAVGFVIAAGIDWMWELTAVSVLGMTLFALLTGPATARAAAVSVARRPARAAFAAVALVAIAIQAILLLGELSIRRSQSQASDGRLVAAVESAQTARVIAPWAPTPYLQLALIREEAGDLEGARRRIGEALERDERDWRLWLVSARIETKLGSVERARRDLARARELHPRSRLFSGS